MTDVEQPVEAPPAAAPPAESLRAYVVRYGITRFVGEFTWKPPQELRRYTSVICRTERGIEWGTVLSPATERTRSYLGLTAESGRVLRIATPDDESQRDAVMQQERHEFQSCRDLIRERGLPMQLIDAEHLFGGDRVVFYYLSEQRVDFRELVKALAKVHKTRIEMRQIGIRDEAKLLADYGDCGQPVCCNTHLREMPPVSMKMAKLQKATLDPNKISGRCGRLKCCLRYEYDTYEEYRKELPSVGATVVTRQGTGRVIGQEILAKKLIVAYEGQRHILVDAGDIITIVSSKATNTSA
jgi:cell fate regulator YaaT (PSP1 superfamily)